MFLAEIFWGREAMGIRSGLIPYASKLPTSISSLFNLAVHKDGTISQLSEKRDVSVLYDWYQIEREKYPQNSLLIFASSWHHYYYPSSLYGLGAWATVDLLFFLPEIPMTYIGEELGWMKNPDITQGRFISPNIYKNWNLNQIKGHYEHRISLRKKYSGFFFSHFF